MLHLTRRSGESVDLTDNRTGERVGTITLLGIADNGQARIGFDCPAHIRITRDNMKRRDGNGDSASEDEVDG